MITDPVTGDVYIAESHMDVRDPGLVGRISVFDKNGKFLRSFGKSGMGPGEFRTPHALAFDSKGNLVVADRHNHRVQLLTKTGEFLREYDDFSRVSGLGGRSRRRPVRDRFGVHRRCASRVVARYSNRQPPRRAGDDVHPAAYDDSPEGAMGEGIAIDPHGNLYVAESIVLGVTKYVKEAGQ